MATMQGIVGVLSFAVGLILTALGTSTAGSISGVLFLLIAALLWVGRSVLLAIARLQAAQENAHVQVLREMSRARS